MTFNLYYSCLLGLTREELQKSTCEVSIGRLDEEEQQQRQDAQQYDDDADPDEHRGRLERVRYDRREAIDGAGTRVNLTGVLEHARLVEPEVSGTLRVVRVAHPLGLYEHDDRDDSVAYREDTPHYTDRLGIAGVLVVVRGRGVLVLHVHDGNSQINSPVKWR